MRILLTRAEPDARRSAERLAALGHEVVLAPLFDLAPTDTPPPGDAFDRLLATSAHAFEPPPEAAQTFRALPLDVVGERTAAAARAAGFAQIDRVAADAKALALQIARSQGPLGSFLYLAGRERRPDLEAALGALGHRVVPWVVYEAREARDAGRRLAQALRGPAIDAVLHFSPRSAALYRALAAQAGLEAQALAPTQIAISPRAAESLAGAPRVRIAPTPDLGGMIACL